MGRTQGQDIGQGIGLQLLDRLGEAGFRPQFIQGLVRRDEGNGLQVLPPRQAAGQGLRLGRAHLRFEKERDGRRLLPALAEPFQVTRQDIEGPRQGQGDTDHQDRHQGRQGGAAQPAQTGQGSLQMMPKPDPR